MKRACKLSLKFLTAKKKKAISSLLLSYRQAVNFYIKICWNNKNNRLDKETLALLKNTRLSERYKSNALKQALEIISSTRLSAKKLKVIPSCPVFTGSATLDAKFITIEKGRCSFDLVVKLSTLRKRKTIYLPLKKTKMVNKWLNKPLAKFVQGCCLNENYISLWIDLPELPNKTEGKIIGIDIGVNKLVADSDANFYGTDFIELRDKVLRKKQGSKAHKRVIIERNNYINGIVKKLPWDKLKVLGVEDLKNLKKGKRKNRSKKFRKAMIPWRYRQVLERVKHLSQENRVLLVEVSPSYTSRICPKCGKESELNRKGECFLCISCGYKADADYVGAQNILARTLDLIGSLESPSLKVEAI